MFQYPNSLQEAKTEIKTEIEKLKAKGYHIFHSAHPLEDGYEIDKYTIKSKKKPRSVVVLSSGLHGIEGYVGHCATIEFLQEFLPKINQYTEVILYHIINPYGMDHYQRTNKNNVDLNRNFIPQGTTVSNENYQLIQEFFAPKKVTNLLLEGTKFYASLMNEIRKHGAPKLNRAILLGQNIDPQGLYFTGLKRQEQTEYIINEAKDLNKEKYEQIIWLDIHTGYGPKDQMSIINSKYEIDTTIDMIETLNYPLILGAKNEDIYNSFGDIIEYLYQLNKTKTFYGTCFEFGTVGNTLLHNINTLKALTFANHLHFMELDTNISTQIHMMMQKYFMPQDEVWRIKASHDFHQATTDILTYFKII
jgi:predicted deacylase